MFNRSFTFHSTASAGGGGCGEGESKKSPLLQSSSPIERRGSLKNFYSYPSEKMTSAGNSLKGKVRKLCSLFETRKQQPSTQNSQTLPPPSPSKQSNVESGSYPLCNSPIRLPGTEDRVVIFFTSLRGIRRTFENCYSVRMILKGFRVRLDERDISMDSAYKKELQSVLQEKICSLPQVFIKGNYIGGAEVIKQLNETGELPKLLKGLPTCPPGYVCEGCGDARFLPCSSCNGSRKYFDEDEEQYKKCPDCNENGLVRCPACCY